MFEPSLVLGFILLYIYIYRWILPKPPLTTGVLGITDWQCSESRWAIGQHDCAQRPLTATMHQDRELGDTLNPPAVRKGTRGGRLTCWRRTHRDSMVELVYKDQSN